MFFFFLSGINLAHVHSFYFLLSRKGVGSMKIMIWLQLARHSDLILPPKDPSSHIPESNDILFLSLISDLYGNAKLL